MKQCHFRAWTFHQTMSLQGIIVFIAGHGRFMKQCHFKLPSHKKDVSFLWNVSGQTMLEHPVEKHNRPRKKMQPKTSVDITSK